jgi:hypothetical protein
MKEISLKSAARFSVIHVDQLIKGHSVDITFRNDEKSRCGVYSWEEVKQFVRELAEALDMTLETAAPEAEPIVLPKDVYEEVERCMKYIYSDENTVEIKRRADAKLWSLCRSNNEEGLDHYIADNAGASIDIARIFMGELPYECENKRSWVLTVQSGNFLSKASINESGGWTLEYSRDIKEAIKCPSYLAAVKLEDTVSHVSTLEIEEV